MPMDENQRQLASEILAILEAHGDVCLDDLAVMTGKPVETVRQIWEQLTDQGVLVRKNVVINWDRWGEERVLARVELKLIPEREYGFDKVAERIARYPQVKELQLMSGSYDLSVLIEGKTLREVADFVAQRLAALDQVSGTSTYFVLKTYKQQGILLEKMDDDPRLEVTP